MTPVFFSPLNTDLEITIQTQASYRFGDGEWSYSFEHTQTYLTNCIFKKCLHLWTILQVSSEQEKQSIAHWRDALSILKNYLQGKFLPCLYNGDKAKVMVWLKKTGYTDITLYVFLLSQTMGMCAA